MANAIAFLAAGLLLGNPDKPPVELEARTVPAFP